MKEFLKFSNLLGQDPALVQGAGGNTSVKQDNVLTVKASGFTLKDLTENRGLVSLMLPSITDYLKLLDGYSENLEKPFNDLIISQRLPDQAAIPSIETGMHAILLKTYIFHTHHVYTNVFNCMKGGENLLRQLFPDAVFVDYQNPGLELALALKNISAPVIFLKNHGLITQSDQASQAFEATQQITQITLDYLKSKGLPEFEVKKIPADLSHHLFPDSVVYSQVDFSKLPETKQQVYWEITSVHNYILSAIKKLGGQPVFLDSHRVKFLQNMEQEKHRINLLLNANS